MSTPRFLGITVHSLRGLSEVTIDGASRVNLLVGANNTGKTTVLEAARLLCDPLSMRSIWACARGRTEQGLGESRLESFRWLFPGGNVDGGTVAARGWGAAGDIRFALRAQEAREIPRKRPGHSSRRPTQSEWTQVLTLHPEVYVEGQPLRERTLTVREDSLVRERAGQSPLVPCVSVSPVAHRTASLDDALGQTWVDGLLPAVVEAIQGFDPTIRDLRKVTVDGEESYYVEREGQRPAPLNTFGDGLRRVLTYAARIVQCRNGLLLIDEIETALHFSALQKTYAWLVRACELHNVQLFATTHSLEALDAILASVAPGEPRRVHSDNEFDAPEAAPAGAENLVVFRLERQADGHTVQRLSGPEAWDLRYRGGLELR